MSRIFGIVWAFLIATLLVASQVCLADDPIVITNTFPPYVTAPPPGAPTYPTPGVCGSIVVYHPANGNLNPSTEHWCIRGYVTWLVGTPVAYYLERDNDFMTILIWSKETIDANFHPDP